MAYALIIHISEIPPDGGIQGILFFIFTLIFALFLFQKRLSEHFFQDSFSAADQDVFLPEQTPELTDYHPVSPRKATSYYIVPNYLEFEPQSGFQPSPIAEAGGNLFEAVDKFIRDETIESKFLVILGNAGMGKSSFSLNYHARHMEQFNKKYDLILLRLGAPGIDRRIIQAKNKHNTVIFLDGFNEDTHAEIDPAGRLQHLMDLTRGFLRVVITCRSQFFPNNEELPELQGIFHISPELARYPEDYPFYKLYLAPFSGAQVDRFLERRFQIGQTRQREKVRKIIASVPEEILNPIFLVHILELADVERDFQYTHEYYEELIKLWAIREADAIDRFSPGMILQIARELAVDIYQMRMQREEESISREEFEDILRPWQGNPLDWGQSERSLLIKDRQYRFRFVHRSFLEFLFVEAFKNGFNGCREATWSKQMQTFLWEYLQKWVNAGEAVPIDLSGVDLSFYQQTLRFTPLQELMLPEIQLDTTEAMIKRNGFFDRYFNEAGEGLPHLFELKEVAGQGAIIDHVTRLMWQPSGSDDKMNLDSALDWIVSRNARKVGGFDDWRLPTLEEALSLMSKDVQDGIHIDQIFDNRQTSIWTIDREGDSAGWIVNYDDGFCHRDNVEREHFVRAVRTAYK